MQVIGLCRFSFPALGDFQIEHDTVEERRRHLYHPTRLEERFRLFESLTLPSFRAQTDEDFQLLIAVGECLPKAALDRLKDLTTDIKQVQIIQRAVDPDQKHRQVMKQILQIACSHPDRPCLQFRHDDDDSVSIDFVEKLREAADDGAGLIKKNQAIGIDFNNGYQASFGPAGTHAAQVYKSLLGVGLGMLVSGGCTHTIISFTHNRIGRFMPVISYPDHPMWIRSLNNSNDSPRAGKQKAQLAPITPEIESEFATRFAINPRFARLHQSSA
ncbi:putative rhamnosyl transferase [Ruegeria conchae]|uniref:putative rhamnosyl transferase n=1 Tax=Ruegeria conchae TaxID=981384 RepID=UPI0021A5C702|nr:putative rhamnosyl transferase [Ruegeria conchae]UWR03567.1 putative rhamnosyl transferase [Ruegeria conchae]